LSGAGQTRNECCRRPARYGCDAYGHVEKWLCVPRARHGRKWRLTTTLSSRPSGRASIRIPVRRGNEPRRRLVTRRRSVLIARHALTHGPLSLPLFGASRGTYRTDRESLPALRRAEQHGDVPMVFRPRSECEGQDKREAPYLNYDLNIRRDFRLLGGLRNQGTRQGLTIDLRRQGGG
jgi:hypothetical protein